MTTIALVVVAAVAAVAGFVAGCRVARRYCAHTWTLQLSSNRVWLECPLCGETSPGWALTLGQPRAPQPRPPSRPSFGGVVWPPTMH
jgi:hypothetical protein